MESKEEWNIQATGGKGQSQAQGHPEPEMREVTELLFISLQMWTSLSSSAAVWLVSRTEHVADNSLLVLHLGLYYSTSLKLRAPRRQQVP